MTVVMCHSGIMERVSVRDLRLKTSALIKNVAQGETCIIASRGVAVAELRPITGAASD